MKGLIIPLLLLLTVAAIKKREKFLTSNQDDSFHNDPAFDKLQEISEHPLGAKILQTIGLQIESGDSLASISKLLNDLKGDLEVPLFSTIRANKWIRTARTPSFNPNARRIWTIMGSGSI
jgi:hypothetical protein